MMGKMFVGILTAVIVLSISVTTAFSEAFGVGGNDVQTQGQDNCSQNSVGENFIDADSNGICDNYESGQDCGNGENHGIQNGCKENFIDADSNGICDNYDSGRNCGNGENHGIQNRCRENFIDADSNGICDNYEDVQKHAKRSEYSCRGGRCR